MKMKMKMKILSKHYIRRMMMNEKDRVMVELDEYLDTLEEDYVDPAQAKIDRAEYLADQEDRYYDNYKCDF